MKKLGLSFRGVLENRIKSNLKESNSVFVIKYSKLSSPDLSLLRQSLRSSGASLFVAKNTVVKRALKDSGLDNLISFLEGPCGLIFIKDEPVNASRVLYNFSKEHEQLKLEGGVLKDKVLQRKDIEALARLPSREVLRAQVVMALVSPISGLAIVLNQTLRKFVWCLEQVKQKRSAEKSPPTTDHSPQ